MEQHKGKIGLKEYIAIIILTIGTKLADDTPAIIFDKLYTATWMLPIVTGLISIIPIYFLLRISSHYPKSNLMDICQRLFGKAVGYIIILLLWIIGMTAYTLDTAIYTDIIGTMYFTETPTIVIYMILMGVSAYGAKKGLEQIGSVAWAVFAYVMISLSIALILAFGNGNSHYLFPIFGPGKWEIVKESSLKLSIFCDFIYFGVIATNISSNKDYRKGTWISLVILIIVLPIAIMAYLILFDYESVKLLNYPFHETIRYISIGFLTSIETFFLPFWLVASFIRFSVYLYLSAIMFGWLFRIKNFEYLIPTLATLIVIVGMIPETPTFSVLDIKGKIMNLITPFFLILPILLWLLMKLRGGKVSGEKSL
jgi:spore germination protein KB